MPRTQGLTALAVLHHVTAAMALLSMIDYARHPTVTGLMLVFVMQIAAFAFFSVTCAPPRPSEKNMRFAHTPEGMKKRVL